MLLDDDTWKEQRNSAHVPTSKRYQKLQSKGYVTSPPRLPKKTGRFASGLSNQEVLLLRPAGPNRTGETVAPLPACGRSYKNRVSRGLRADLAKRLLRAYLRSR
jgi:hypothetical protein